MPLDRGDNDHVALNAFRCLGQRQVGLHAVQASQFECRPADVVNVWRYQSEDVINSSL